MIEGKRGLLFVLCGRPVPVGKSPRSIVCKDACARQLKPWLREYSLQTESIEQTELESRERVVLRDLIVKHFLLAGKQADYNFITICSPYSMGARA